MFMLEAHSDNCCALEASLATIVFLVFLTICDVKVFVIQNSFMLTLLTYYLLFNSNTKYYLIHWEEE